jgi:pyruvate dehydrogenase E2 component (dihydrolipoamide acetyltransferase)
MASRTTGHAAGYLPYKQAIVTARLCIQQLPTRLSIFIAMQVPGVNASWQKDFIRQYNNVDMSVAVQTPVGLLTPIVKDAHAKGLAAISADVKTLAKKVTKLVAKTH